MWWLALGLASLVVFALWRRFKDPPKTSRGMKHFARNKARQKEVSDYFSFRAALLAEVPSMDDSQLREGIEAMLAGSTDERRVWGQVFEKVGSRGVPFLQDATRDSRCDPEEPYSGEDSGHAFAAITRALSCSGDPSVVRLLAAWTNSTERSKRNHALICIGHAGLTESVPFLRRAIRSDSEDDLAYAVIGVDWGARTQHAAPFFRTELTEELLRLCLPTCKLSTLRTYGVPEVLTKLAPVDAVRLLSGPEYLRADNRILPEILRAINNVGKKLDIHTVQSLLAESRKMPLSDRLWNKVRVECLKALALVDPFRARQEIDVEMASSDKDVRDGAVEALRISLALPDWYKLWSSDESFESFPEVVQNIAAAVEFENEVNNGGISQYLSNSSGDHAEIVLRAFRVIGSVECERLLSQAMAFAGPKGSSSDRRKRVDWYGKLSDENERSLDDLSSQFYEQRDRLHLCLVRYMEANRPLIEQRVRETASRQPE